MPSANLVIKERSKQAARSLRGFLGNLEEFSDLREFAEVMGLDFEREGLDQDPRDLKDLEGQEQAVGGKGVNKEGGDGEFTLDVDIYFCSHAYFCSFILLRKSPRLAVILLLVLFSI